MPQLTEAGACPGTCSSEKVSRRCAEGSRGPSDTLPLAALLLLGPAAALPLPGSLPAAAWLGMLPRTDRSGHSSKDESTGYRPLPAPARAAA